VTVHATPSPHTLLDASRRFSQLRGLNSASSLAGTGGGENNLAFKCMRKRLVVETLHLDVEGGVGERRTTPFASAAVDSTPQTAHEEIKDEPQLAKVVIETPPEQLLDTLPAADKITPKKARKKVAFKTAETDLYDF
jgi:elongator complex protein 4